MAEKTNTAERLTTPRRWYQFRLRTLLIGVALLGLLEGAIRWLIILVGGTVAASVLVGLAFAIIYGVVCSKTLWFWQQWCRWQVARDKALEMEATRILLESEEVKEAIRALKSDQSQNQDGAPATRT